MRSLKLDRVREARILLNKAQLRTERLIAANKVIQDRAAGFAETMAVITAVAPPDVRVTTLDDDGRIVAVEAEASEYSILLDFIKLLDEIPQFDRVQILNLGQVKRSDTDSGLEPAEQTGGATVVRSVVEMSIEITRTYSGADENQNFSDEELAVADNQGSVPVPK